MSHERLIAGHRELESILALILEENTQQESDPLCRGQGILHPGEAVGVRPAVNDDELDTLVFRRKDTVLPPAVPIPLLPRTVRVRPAVDDDELDTLVMRRRDVDSTLAPSPVTQGGGQACRPNNWHGESVAGALVGSGDSGGAGKPAEEGEAGQARSCLAGVGNELPSEVGKSWPGVEQAGRNFPGSEGVEEWHEECNEQPPAGSEDDMAPLGVEYEVVDLEGDLDGGPARPERHIPEDIAMLSGGLFDKLPRVEVPLETFFPSEYLGSPAWHRTRSDSLIPMATSAPEEAPRRRVTPSWFVGMAAAAVIGMMAGAVAQRPLEPAAAQPAASPKPALAQVAAPEYPAVEAARAPEPSVKATNDTGRIPSRARAAASALSAGPAPSSAASVDPSKPVIENMPIVAAPPPAPPAPEMPAQQSTAIAVAAAGRGAAGCLAPDDLRRTMAVSVTFAPSGKATRAVIEGGPHRATTAGSCIAQRLRSATVKPFEGPAVTIHTSVHIR